MPRPKWNRIVVEEDAGVMEVHETPEGKRLMAGLNIAAQSEDVEQVRQGYRCLNCWEPLESAWPRACPLCSCPVTLGGGCASTYGVREASGSAL